MIDMAINHPLLHTLAARGLDAEAPGAPERAVALARAGDDQTIRALCEISYSSPAAAAILTRALLDPRDGVAERLTTADRAVLASNPHRPGDLQRWLVEHPGILRTLTDEDGDPYLLTDPAAAEHLFDAAFHGGDDVSLATLDWLLDRHHHTQHWPAYRLLPATLLRLSRLPLPGPDRVPDHEARQTGCETARGAQARAARACFSLLDRSLVSASLVDHSLEQLLTPNPGPDLIGEAEAENLLRHLCQPGGVATDFVARHLRPLFPAALRILTRAHDTLTDLGCLAQLGAGQLRRVLDDTVRTWELLGRAARADLASAQINQVGTLARHWRTHPPHPALVHDDLEDPGSVLDGSDLDVALIGSTIGDLRDTIARLAQAKAALVWDEVPLATLRTALEKHRGGLLPGERVSVLSRTDLPEDLLRTVLAAMGFTDTTEIDRALHTPTVPVGELAWLVALSPHRADRALGTRWASGKILNRLDRDQASLLVAQAATLLVESGANPCTLGVTATGLLTPHTVAHELPWPVAALWAGQNTHVQALVGREVDAACTRLGGPHTPAWQTLLRLATLHGTLTDPPASTQAGSPGLTLATLCQAALAVEVS